MYVDRFVRVLFITSSVNFLLFNEIAGLDSAGHDVGVKLLPVLFITYDEHYLPYLLTGAPVNASRDQTRQD